MPVLVFIHGGGYEVGYEGWLDSDGALLAQRSGSVVFECNYRLGALGFLAGRQWLSERDPQRSSSGNYGVQDQRMALRWARSNAAAFGGDPSRLTMFGQSAGAGAVSAHLVMPASHGAFDGAMMESGGFSNWAARAWAVAESTYDALAQATGCRGAAQGEDRCLLELDALALANASILSHEMNNVPNCNPNVCCRWGPTVDGVELAAHVQRLGLEGKVADVPIMAGSNARETAGFWGGLPLLPTPLSPNISEAAVGTVVQQNYGLNASQTNEVLALYPIDSHWPTFGYSPAYQQLVDLSTDVVFGCAARRTLRQAAGQGRKAANRVWGYIFGVDTYDRNGTLHPSVHGAELPYVFQTANDPSWLALSMAQQWGAFAASGDPNPLPEACRGTASRACQFAWPVYTPTTDVRYHYGAQGVEARGHLHEIQCSWWEANDPTFPDGQTRPWPQTSKASM